MKFTLSWLHQHLETDASLTEITDCLTRIGLELEQIDNPAESLRAFKAAYVVEAVQHPNADRLRVCKVDTGSEVVQVVCGAPNARTGMKGIFAASGSHIPGTDLLLKKSKIRGVESNGMLCSEREMGLSDEHDGIIDLPADTPIGASVVDLFGLDDPVIEVGITPNRQDCLGVYGIARDLAAAGLGTLKPLNKEPVEGAYKSPIGLTLDFDTEMQNACSCFYGRYFRGLKNGPSPDWLQQRLKAIGLRPISALVDITNYVTYDLGRPLHVFDAHKVTGNISARMGRAGEKLAALNGKIYDIDDSMTVIADEAGPEALGGIMGGEASGCTGTTTEMFLEVALFDPLRTAVTGRKLQIDSDARYRFERGIDPEMVAPGIEIATRLILELCGGETSEVVKAGSPETPVKTVTFRPARVKNLAGLDIRDDRQADILSALGFEITARADAGWQVNVPSWRSDVDGEADLVEEITRIVGYDAVPSVAMPRLHTVTQPAWTPAQRRVPAAKRLLANRSLVECVTWSFQSAATANLFGAGGRPLYLANPISSELDAMRPSVLGNLIQSARQNIDRGFSDLGLFEVGPVYERGGDADAGSDDSDAIHQQTVAGAVRCGQITGRHWQGKARPVDAYDAKADVLALLAALGGPAGNARMEAGGPDWYHPGRVSTVKLGPKTTLAVFGEVHPRILAALDVDGPMVAFEVYLDAIPMARQKASKARPALAVSDLQPVARDFAFVVDHTVPADKLIRAVAGADKQLITGVDLFDVYTGDRIDGNRKSLALSVTLQPRDKTLTDSEIDATAEKIVKAAAKATGATLRGG